MLWIKALHIVFVISWFAGLFYLPRIFVNLAMETETAAHRTPAADGAQAVPLHDDPGGAGGGIRPVAVAGLRFRPGPGNGWLHAKLALVLLLIGYHHACGSLLKKFERAPTSAVTRGTAGSTKCPSCCCWRSSSWWSSNRSDEVA